MAQSVASKIPLDATTVLHYFKSMKCGRTQILSGIAGCEKLNNIVAAFLGLRILIATVICVAMFVALGAQGKTAPLILPLNKASMVPAFC